MYNTRDVSLVWLVSSSSQQQACQRWELVEAQQGCQVAYSSSACVRGTCMVNISGLNGFGGCKATGSPGADGSLQSLWLLSGWPAYR